MWAGRGPVVGRGRRRWPRAGGDLEAVRRWRRRWRAATGVTRCAPAHFSCRRRGRPVERTCRLKLRRSIAMQASRVTILAWRSSSPARRDERVSRRRSRRLQTPSRLTVRVACVEGMLSGCPEEVLRSVVSCRAPRRFRQCGRERRPTGRDESSRVVKGICAIAIYRRYKSRRVESKSAHRCANFESSRFAIRVVC